MVSSEFNKRKEIISNYFRHPRWIYHGENDWDFEYYKGKRNMQELEAALKIVFGDEYTVYDKRWFKNNDGEIVGATILCGFYVGADFNGVNQGTGGGDCYVSFNLCRYGFFYNQSSNLDYLKNQLN